MRLELFDSGNLKFVEFNTTGDKENFVRCDEESKYLDTEVFNIFIDCFENSNPLYDYIQPTLYGTRKIIPLLNELKKKEEQLSAIKTEHQFTNYINSEFWGKDFIEKTKKEYKKKDWHYYLNALHQINLELIQLVELCINEERVLWVIGA